MAATVKKCHQLDIFGRKLRKQVSIHKKGRIHNKCETLIDVYLMEYEGNGEKHKTILQNANQNLKNE